jgi:hypothetical protein
VSILPLPAYSPELKPVEKWSGFLEGYVQKEFQDMGSLRLGHHFG